MNGVVVGSSIVSNVGGNPCNSIYSTNTPTNKTNVTIGRYEGTYSTTAFAGLIDEPRVYNDTLLPAEISDLNTSYGYVTQNYQTYNIVRLWHAANPNPSYGFGSAESQSAEVISVTLNTTSVNFNPITAGGGNTSCTNSFPVNVTIESETNVAVNISVNASGNYVAGANSFAIQNSSYSNDTVSCKTEMTLSFRSGNCGSPTTNYSDWLNIADAAFDQFIAVYFWLQVPIGTPKDSYATQLYVKVEKA